MKYLWLIAWLIIGGNLQAQTPAVEFLPPDTLQIMRNARVSIGWQAGWGQTNLRGSDLNQLSADGTTQPLGSFTAGIQAQIYLGKYFRLLHEINLQQGGCNLLLTDNNGNNYHSYLRIWAVQVVPFAPTFYYSGFSLTVAPYVSALIDGAVMRRNAAGALVKDKYIFGDPQNTTQTEKYLQKLDAGIGAGIGYTWKKWNINMRYQIGMIPVVDNANVFTFDQEKPYLNIYNQGWQMRLGYSW